MTIEDNTNNISDDKASLCSAELFHLIGKYTDQTMTAEEADRLFKLVEQNQESRRSLVLNVLVDILLREKSGTLKTILSEYGQFPPLPPQEEFLFQPDYQDLPEIQDLPEEELNPLEYDWNTTFPSFWNDIPQEPDMGQTIYLSPEQKPTHVARWRASWSSLWKQRRKKRLPPPLSPRQLQQKKRRANLFFVLRVIVFISLIVWLTLQPKIPVQPRKHLIGTVAHTVDAVWEEGPGLYKRHQQLDQNELRLKSGIVSLEFYNGVRLTLEGPARLVVTDSMNVLCQQGKLSVLVPEGAKGFTVATPQGRFIDRGTEFALDVNETGSQLEVIRGQVDVGQTGTETINPVFTGEGSIVNMAGPVKTFNVSRTSYISLERLGVLVGQYIEKVMGEKQKKEIVWDKSPDLLARFDFIGAKRGPYRNLALQAAETGETAVAEGCSLTTGRFSGLQTTGLDYRGDRIKMRTSGKGANLTLLANVRIDSMKNRTNVLFCCNGFSSLPGTFLWQVLSDGRMWFQLHLPVGKDSVQKNEYLEFASDPCISPRIYGTWVQLAVVMDSGKHTVTFYLDGLPVTTRSSDSLIPFEISGGTLGNFEEGKTMKNPRYFNGAFENFYLFNKALTAEEIGALKLND